MIRYHISESGRLEADCRGTTAVHEDGSHPTSPQLSDPPGIDAEHHSIASPPAVFLASLSLAMAVGVLTPIPALQGTVGGGGAALLIAAGLGLNAVGSRQFEDAGTPIKPLTPSTALVVGGVFRISRNPMYLGMALVLVGAAVGLGSAVALVAVPAFVWVVTRLFIGHEEKMLSQRFGTVYDDYRSRVRRWI